MIRTQIQFTEDQYRRLREWAGRLGISVSEAVRRCVDSRLAGRGEDVHRAGLVRDAEAVLGKYSDSRAGDVARRHDEALDEAFGE